MSMTQLTYDDDNYEEYTLTDKIRHDVMCIAYSDSSLEDAQYMMRIMQTLDELERRYSECSAEGDMLSARCAKLERAADKHECTISVLKGRIEQLQRELDE